MWLLSSAAQAQRLWHTGLSCSAACGIFPDQASNLYPALASRFLPLSHQGSPSTTINRNGWDLLGTVCQTLSLAYTCRYHFILTITPGSGDYYYIHYREEKTVWVSQVACSTLQLVGGKNKLNSCYLTPNYLNACYSDTVPPLGWNTISVRNIDRHILSDKWYSFAYIWFCPVLSSSILHLASSQRYRYI